MFDETKCDFCGECLERCSYIDFDRHAGARELKKLVQGYSPEWLRDCITCFACNEFCLKGARPFDLILQGIERLGNYIDPGVVAVLKEKFTISGDFKPPSVTSPVLSLCTIESVIPGAFTGPLFDGLDIIKGRFWSCNVLFAHLGSESIFLQDIIPLLDRYQALGVEEVIFAHDDCYALMTYWVPQMGLKLPFKATHLLEYLMRILEAHKNEIRPLNRKVAYQRPCASRLTPWKDVYLDEIFSLIGVDRVLRLYDREDALCCGQSMKNLVSKGDKYPGYQVLNVHDAKLHEAEAMIFLCPMCFDALQESCRESGLECFMISDICTMALTGGQ